MEIIKKIALLIALVFMLIIKLPFSLLGYVISFIEMWLVSINRRLVGWFDDEFVRIGWDLAMDFNIACSEDAQEAFEEMKFEE